MWSSKAKETVHLPLALSKHVYLKSPFSFLFQPFLYFNIGRSRGVSCRRCSHEKAVESNVIAGDSYLRFSHFYLLCKSGKGTYLMLLSHRNAEYLVLCTFFARQLACIVGIFILSTGDVIYMITYISAVKRDGDVRSYII